MSISGKLMAVKLGSTPVVVAGAYSWEAEESIGELESTTAADGGYANRDGGVKDCVVRIKGYMDVTAGVYVSLQAGTLLTSLKLYRATTDSAAAFTFPSAIVLKSTQGGEVKGRIEFTAEVKNKGTYTYADPA